MGTPVVVASGTLTCVHGGKSAVTTAMTSSRLTVGGKGVLLVGSESGVSFAASSPPCNNKTSTNDHSPAPCTTGNATAGTSTRLSVGTVGVVLGSATGITTAVPTATTPPLLTWKVDAPGSSRLTVG